jgi:hypothetical protein
MTWYEENREYVLRRARAERIRRGKQPAVRLCRRCGEPATSSRHQYCAVCRALAEATHRRSSAERNVAASTTARGYGTQHQRLREKWRPKVEAGGVACGYCGLLIAPGTAWHLGHPNDRKDLPPTPWHRKCNTTFAATVTKRRRTQERKAS